MDNGSGTCKAAPQVTCAETLCPSIVGQPMVDMDQKVEDEAQSNAER